MCIDLYIIKYVQLQPNGFYFRRKTYSSVNEIIREFKNNPKGRDHRSGHQHHQHYSHRS